VQGPLVGRILSEVEEWWVESDFTGDKFSLAERLKAVVQAIAY
jgi:poly(A) polymerase